MVPFQRQVFEPQTARMSQAASVAPPQSSGNTDMIAVLIVGGLALAAAELSGLTHVTKWAKKELGFSK